MSELIWIIRLPFRILLTALFVIFIVVFDSLSLMTGNFHKDEFIDGVKYIWGKS